MNKLKSNLHFRLMAFVFKVRDLFSPPEKTLKDISIEPGSRVLDFGRGPGSFSLAVAQMIGSQGRVYALDFARKRCPPRGS